MSRHQRPRVPTFDIVLSAEEVRGLLSQLCIRLGFWLPPKDLEPLAAAPSKTIDGFTEEVFVAEVSTRSLQIA